MKLSKFVFSALSTALFMILILVFTCIPKTCKAITADELKNQLSGQELKQAGGMIKKKFATHADKKMASEDEERSTYFRLSLAGKHKQVVENAILMTLLAATLLIIRRVTTSR